MRLAPDDRNIGADSERELETAAETRWIADVTGDGGLLVKLRHLDPVKSDDPNRVHRVRTATDSPIDDGVEGFRDVRVKLDRPGVVMLDGHVNSEVEAAQVIDAALGVAGVEAVVAYIDSRARETTSSRSPTDRSLRLHSAGD